MGYGLTCIECGNTARSSIQIIEPSSRSQDMNSYGGRIITKYYCGKHLKEELLNGDLK